MAPENFIFISKHGGGPSRNLNFLNFRFPDPLRAKKKYPTKGLGHLIGPSLSSEFTSGLRPLPTGRVCGLCGCGKWSLFLFYSSKNGTLEVLGSNLQPTVWCFCLSSSGGCHIKLLVSRCCGSGTVHSCSPTSDFFFYQGFLLPCQITSRLRFI